MNLVTGQCWPVNVPGMRILFGFIRFIFMFIVLGTVALLATAVLTVVGLLLLITGRRPQFKVYSARDFREPFHDPFFDRPPMRDVTPKSGPRLAGQSE